MKKLLKIILFVIIGCILFFALSQVLLAFPSLLFHERASYKNFQVFSDKVIEKDLNRRLDSISLLLASTGFYNRNNINIIFCHSVRLAGFLNAISLAPTGAGFNHFSGNIYLFNSRIEAFRTENAKAKGDEEELIENTYQSFELDKLLTHEILHKLHCDTLGVWAYKRKLPSPHWKAEGFAEYYTFARDKRRDGNYDLKKRVGLYLKYKDQFPLFYYKSQLLYEFLVDYQKLDFSEIMHDSVTEENTFDQLSQWYHKN